MIDRFEQAIARLEFSPFAGKVPDDDELRQRSYRMLIVGKYLVFYKVKETAGESAFEETGEMSGTIHFRRSTTPASATDGGRRPVPRVPSSLPSVVVNSPAEIPATGVNAF